VAQAAPTPGESESVEGKEAEPHRVSSSELQRQLNNPVTSLWSLQFQFNNYRLDNGKWNYNLLFQPVLPISLTKDLNLVTRPVITLSNRVPHETARASSTAPPGWAIWLWWNCCRLRTRATGFSEPGLPPTSRLRPGCSRGRASGRLGPPW
jgi:hypothetical protein